MFSSERIRLLHVLNNFKTCQKLVTRVLSRLLLQSVNQLMQTQHSEVVDMLLALIQTRFDYDFLQSYNEVFHDFFFFNSCGCYWCCLFDCCSVASEGCAAKPVRTEYGDHGHGQQPHGTSEGRTESAAGPAARRTITCTTSGTQC